MTVPFPPVYAKKSAPPEESNNAPTESINAKNSVPILVDKEGPQDDFSEEECD